MRKKNPTRANHKNIRLNNWHTIGTPSQHGSAPSVQKHDSSSVGHRSGALSGPPQRRSHSASNGAVKSVQGPRQGGSAPGVGSQNRKGEEGAVK